MRIAIDCFKLVKGSGKSIGIYNVALNIVQSLGKINSNTDKKEEIYVLGNKHNKEDFDIDGITFVCIEKYNPLSKKDALLWELFLVNAECKRLNIEKVVFPRGYSTLFHPIKDIVIIHDLIPFFYHDNFPNVFNRLENYYIMQRLRASAISSSKIITISQASKLDIIKRFGINEDKICVINNACGISDYSFEKTSDSKTYISAITSDLPHKNAIGVLKTYEEYCNKVRDPLNLKIIGINDLTKYDIPQKIKEKITCYKYIKNNNDKDKLISNSLCFLFLSLIEGFGLPPIEAMQLKVPVICSDTSSLPEVVGNAAILADPNNYKETAEKLIELLENKEIQDRLINDGLVNIKRFDNESRAELYWKELVE